MQHIKYISGNVCLAVNSVLISINFIMCTPLVIIYNSVFTKKLRRSISNIFTLHPSKFFSPSDNQPLSRTFRNDPITIFGKCSTEIFLNTFLHITFSPKLVIFHSLAFSSPPLLITILFLTPFSPPLVPLSPFLSFFRALSSLFLSRNILLT